MTDTREIYKRWVFEGNCPRCFPDWEYPDISIAEVWVWQDELNAWDVYEEIIKEAEDD